MMGGGNLAIILLNWNGWEDTVECLESLLRGTWQDFTVIVIDNGSEDDSPRRIIHRFKAEYETKEFTLEGVEKGAFKSEGSDQKIILIKSRENLGFARGCNHGIRLALESGFKKIMLLNNDTVVEEKCLERLDAFHNAHPEYPVITPLINYYKNPDTIWCFGGRLTFSGRRSFYFRNKPVKNIRKEYKPVTFVSGCALFSDSEIFRRFGFLTEKFFFGQEDYHFSQVMSDNGIEMAAVADAVVFHKVGSTHEKVFHENRLPYMFIGYLNRFVDRKMFSKTKTGWKMWRFINLSYIGPKLMLRDRVSCKAVKSMLKLLITYSDRQTEVGREIFFRAKSLLGVK